MEIQHTKTSALLKVKAKSDDAKLLHALDFLGTYDFMGFETKIRGRGASVELKWVN